MPSIPISFLALWGMVSSSPNPQIRTAMKNATIEDLQVRDPECYKSPLDEVKWEDCHRAVNVFTARYPPTKGSEAPYTLLHRGQSRPRDPKEIFCPILINSDPAPLACDLIVNYESFPKDMQISETLEDIGTFANFLIDKCTKEGLSYGGRVTLERDGYNLDIKLLSLGTLGDVSGSPYNITTHDQ